MMTIITIDNIINNINYENDLWEDLLLKQKNFPKVVLVVQTY